MSLESIIQTALDLAAAAYDAFFVGVLGLPDQRDIWITTSGNPCIFCRHMAQLSQRVNVPVGHPFPVPNYSILVYMNAQSITLIEPARAHDNCQCARVTVPVP